MFACVCWTPFQILNAINYKMNYAPKEEMDVFVCKKFNSAEEIACRLEKLPYIHKVYLVENLDYDSLNGIRGKVKILKDLIFPKKTVEKCIGENIKLNKLEYSYILSSGYLNFNILFNNCFNKRGVPSYFFDDGIESYLKTNTVNTYSNVYKVFSKVTGNGGVNLKPRKLYVYAPEFVDSKLCYEEILKLPSICQLNQSIKSDLNYVFDYSLVEANYNYLIFDQLGTGDFKNNMLVEIQECVLEGISSIIPSEDLIIKMHPRATKPIYGEQYRTFATTAPWEIFLMNMEVGEKVLISLTSTACLTPRMIFDSEPQVIFLYKLFGIENSEAIEEFIYRVKNGYNEPSKVQIPENIEELKAIIKKIEVERINTNKELEA